MIQGKTKNIITYLAIMLIAAFFFILPVKRSAAADVETVTFQTENDVIDAADGYFILRDTTSKLYGLFDGNGKNIIPCQYDEMSFPEDTILYDYLVVKQGSNWGILDYTGKAMIEIKYDSVDPYADGRKVATAYTGNKTEIFNDKGVQIGSISGEYTAVSDEVFQGKTDLRTRKNAAILSLENQNLLFQKEDTETMVANVYAAGKNIVADYNISAASDEGAETFGNMSTYRYIKIFNTKGKVVQEVTPDLSWTEAEEEVVSGGIRVEKVISDHSFIVRLLGYKENYLAIYDINTKSYSELFKNISDFYDDEAFAADEDGTLYIINTSGEKVADNEVTVTGYERLGISKSKHDPFIIFKKVDGEETVYKLYCLNKHMALEDTFTTVTFRRDKDNLEICKGFPLVSNEKKEYTILNKDGETVFEYGLYEKDITVNHVIYSDTNITVVTEDDGKNVITSYVVAESVKKSIWDRITEHAIIFEVIAVIIVILVLFFLFKTLKREQRRRKSRRNIRRRITERKEEGPETTTESLENLDEDAEKEKSESKSTSSIPEEEKETNRNAIDGDFYGQINCLTGEYSGAQIALQKLEWIRIGRDDADNDLVFRKGTISRKHCAIHFDENRNVYYVIDYSRNGVFLEDGTRLPQEEEVEVAPGNKIYLGDNRTIIELAATS